MSAKSPYDFRSGPDLPIRHIGLSLGLGPQDPRGPPANCGTHSVNCRYVISSTIIRQNFILQLFVKFSFFHVFRFRVDNARVFQRISINLNMTVGQATCRLLRRLSQCTLAASCFVTYESGERTCDCLCLQCTYSKLKSWTADISCVYYTLCRASSIILQQK